jgi:CheY-like chemotaxis protein
MVLRENEMPTALIVEDEPEANKLLGLLLKIRGYRSTPALTGGEALRSLHDQAPDVVFLDLMLPDLNGYEICRSVKTSRASCLIPLVVVTARVAPENRVESFRAGADDFVSKPYTPDQIFRALEHAEEFRGRASCAVVEGSASLADPDDGESLRAVAQLHNLVLGRTPLDDEAVGRVNRAIDDVREAVGRWAASHSGEGPASLRYELTPARLVVDFCGCLACLDEPPGAADRAMESARRAFDEVVVDRDQACLSLIKSWA